MITSELTVPKDVFEKETGWTVKLEGACRGEICVPLGGEGTDPLDLTAVAQRLGMPLVQDEDEGLWAVGPATLGGRALQTAVAPDIMLPDLDGKPFRLSSLRGRKVLILVWAPYCGCALDLPVWQRLRTELYPKGLEIVTVGMDTAGADGCRHYIEAAAPEHPALIDANHVMAESFGVVNIPTGIWIDEQGLMVRPAEPAYAPTAESFDALDSGLGGAQLPQRMQDMLGEAEKIPQYREEYHRALNDWVTRGADSQYAMTPDEVVAASDVRDTDTAEAAAHFALAQHLWRNSHTDSAYRHFRIAHRLQPDNIAYKRQAWSLASWTGSPYDRLWQGPLEGREAEWPFDSDMLTEIRQIGPENYYPTTRLNKSTNHED